MRYLAGSSSRKESPRCGTCIFPNPISVNPWASPLRLFRLPMDDENSFEPLPSSSHIIQQILPGGMGRKILHHLDSCPDRVFSLQDPHSLRTLHDSPAQGPFGLIPYEKDRAARIGKTMDEMMKDPSRFAHARGGYDEKGTRHAIQALSLLDGANITRSSEQKPDRPSRMLCRFFRETLVLPGWGCCPSGRCGHERGGGIPHPGPKRERWN
jgi:hypothetical protein